MKLAKVLQNSSGKFTSLIVNRYEGPTAYCAKINSVTDRFVYFYDVNTGVDRRARPDQILSARVGSQSYRA